MARSPGIGSSLRVAVVALAGTFATAQTSPSADSLWTGQAPRDDGPTNVLLVVLDDVGIDMIGAYGVSPDAPPTPVIDGLANNGVRFARAYAQPVCSPTRATVMTGRYAFRTLIGSQVFPLQNNFGLQFGERTIAEVVGGGGYTAVATAAIGKWHLGSPNVGGALHPNLQGFEWFSGTLGNFGNDDYYQHTKYVNGVAFASTTYATTEQVDDALARIDVMPEPWFLLLAFNAAHFPVHAPPPSLHTYPLSGDPQDSRNEHFRAAMQAADTELGRLLATIDPAVLADTTVIVLGDNGTPGGVVTPPFNSHKAKETLYEGGVHVPLVISGKHVASPGRVCDALVNSVDLFPTFLDLFRDQTEIVLPKDLAIDGVSLMPYLLDPSHKAMRTWVYADLFKPTGPGPYTLNQRMLRDTRWKLIEFDDGVDELYDVGTDLLEDENLLEWALDDEQLAAYARLKLQLSEITSQ